MRYTKPFTLVQRHDANRTYRSFRVLLDTMRFVFPPLDAKQRGLMAAFREAVRDFSRALRPKDVKVDVDRLNEARFRADALAIAYANTRNSSPGRFGHS